MESISSSLESGLAQWLTLVHRIWQKVLRDISQPQPQLSQEATMKTNPNHHTVVGDSMPEKQGP